MSEQARDTCLRNIDEMYSAHLNSSENARHKLSLYLQTSS